MEATIHHAPNLNFPSRENFANSTSEGIGYMSKGYIDVLFDQDTSNDVSHALQCHQSATSETVSPTKKLRLSLRRVSVTTPGYSVEQYDLEQLIPIHSVKKLNESCEPSEHNPAGLIDCQRMKVMYGYRTKEQLTRHKATWNAFQHYLNKCIPVKIKNVAMFRDIVSSSFHEDYCNRSHSLIEVDQTTPSEADGASQTCHIIRNMTENSIMCDIATLPSTILDSVITVQCTFPKSSDERLFSPNIIDKALSLSSNTETNYCPTFMGQENQITTKLSLREVTSWCENSSKGNADYDSKQESSTNMAICVAQEPILKVASPSLSIGDIESDSGLQIRIHLDGKVESCHQDSFLGCRDFSHHITPESYNSSLISLLRLPSYFLLGNPNEIYQNDQKNSIFIHDVNLWYAPQRCCTNFHYDEHDNLLLVTEGVKTVEMCPPGCIRGSGIHSEYANHPALLRRQGYKVSETLDSNTELQIKEEISRTIELKQQSTHVVSVPEGYGLYIPAGWWHRVESSNSCTAVNVWFDYTHESREKVPLHMMPYQLRLTARRYYESHAKRMANLLLDNKRKEFLLHYNQKGVLDKFEQVEQKEWIALNDIVLGERFLDAKFVHHFATLFISCWASTSVEDSASISRFRNVFEAFLLSIQLDNIDQVTELVRMWVLFPFSLKAEYRYSTDAFTSSQHISRNFTTLIMGLSPESCYVIMQAWERYGSAVSNAENEEILKEKNSKIDFTLEQSYKHFFDLIGTDRENQTRLFLLAGAEQVRYWVCKSLLCNQLFGL